MKFLERLYMRLKDSEVVKDADFRVLELWHKSVIIHMKSPTVGGKRKQAIGVILSQI